MSFDPEPKAHIKDKIKVVLDLSNYAIKNKVKDAAGVDMSNFDVKKSYWFEIWSWQVRYWWIVYISKWFD